MRFLVSLVRDFGMCSDARLLSSSVTGQTADLRFAISSAA